jgi:hypothetical protein
MMKLRLYLDEDAMDGDLVLALRMRGVDVQTALEAGLIKHPDDEQLSYAASHERALYSFNVSDFAALHTRYMVEGKHHAGIILAQQQ